VTDAMQAAGMPDASSRLRIARVVVVEHRARIADGNGIAGSTLTMDEAVEAPFAGLG
jgi:N-acetylglucosamine-6-phosphate deacetylase